MFRAFLESVRTGQYLNREHEALGEPFKLSRLYESYLATLHDSAEADPAAPALKALDSLLQSSTLLAEGPAALKVKQNLWELLQKLVDLQAIDKVIQRGGVQAVAPLLQSNSAQVRHPATLTRSLTLNPHNLFCFRFESMRWPFWRSWRRL